MLKPVQDKFSIQLFAGFSLLTLLSIFAAFIREEYLLLVIPLAILFAFIAIVDFRKIYLLLFFTLPLSIEYNFSGGFSTDLPTEPIIISLMFILIFYIVANPDAIPRRFYIHSIILILALHIVWTGFLILHSVEFIVSLKFFLAKIWYIAVFVFLTGLLIRSREQFLPYFWALIIPLVIVTVITIIRHALLDFTFEDVNDTLTPYFRNHVNYAAMLSLVIPFVWFFRKGYEKGSIQRNFLTIALLVLLAGIFFAYTRGAWLALIIALAAYFILKWRLMKYVVVIAIAAAVFAIGYLAKDKKYLDYAPNFETTVYHPELGQHLEATFGLEDVSSAERIYRWVASFHMFTEKPIMGYGPGNFYPYYKHHTVESFRTYISENEEKSTVHNYFLLMLVEQGIIGFLIFSLLVGWVLIKAENIYRNTLGKEDKEYVMAVTLCLLIILTQTFLSDLIETDKIGSFFFICIALLVNQDLRNRGVYAKNSLPEATA